MEGKAKEGNAGIHNSKCSTTSKTHKRNSVSVLSQNLASFVLIQFYCFGTCEERNDFLQKPAVQSRALQVEFSSSIVHTTSKHTTIFGWFISSFMRTHMVTSYLFLGGRPIALHGLVHFLTTTGPSNVYAYSDRSSYVGHSVI